MYRPESNRIFQGYFQSASRLVYSRCADLKFDGGKEKVYQSTPISLYRTTRNNGIDYHFFILLLLDKEMIHSLVIRDFCEFLRIRLGKALNER